MWDNPPGPPHCISIRAVYFLQESKREGEEKGEREEERGSARREGMNV